MGTEDSLTAGSHRSPIQLSKTALHALANERLLQKFQNINFSRLATCLGVPQARKRDRETPPRSLSLASGAVAAVGLFDDMLTAGSHFKAAQMVLQEEFPGVPIRGIFLARRVLPEDEESLFDFGDM